METVHVPPKGARINIGDGEWKVIAYRSNSKKMTMRLVGPVKKLPQSALDKQVLKTFDEQQRKEKGERENER